MKVTVAIVTYRRAWALPFSLASIANQTRRPDELIVVLKPSGDGSEEIISRFVSDLPLRLIIQHYGNVTNAVQMALDNARGDIVIFLDDDAIAEEKWVEKYITLFTNIPQAGGISGVTLKAYLKGSIVEKTAEEFYTMRPTKNVFYRKPLPEFVDYVGWISRSGFMGMREPPVEGVFKSALLGGVNMAWRRESVEGCPLAQQYKKSRKGMWFEQLLAYCVRRRGFDTYGVRGPQAPTVWHIVHTQSLTRGRGFWHEFWIHYDRVLFYKRAKRLGARFSPLMYLLGCMALMRRRTLPRLFATLYAWVTKI